MEVWKLRIKLTTDFHSMGVPKGATVDILRDSRGLLIPATQIKGIIRNEAERIVLGKNGGHSNEKELLTVIEDLFGPEEQENRVVGFKNSKLKFFNAYITNKKGLSYRPHLKIDLDTGARSEGALFTQKTVPAGAMFTGFFIVRGMEGLNEDEERLIKGAILSASHYGFGGDRSRGLGSVEIVIEKSNVDELKEAYS